MLDRHTELYILSGKLNGIKKQESITRIHTFDVLIVWNFNKCQRMFLTSFGLIWLYNQFQVLLFLLGCNLKFMFTYRCRWLQLFNIFVEGNSVANLRPLTVMWSSVVFLIERCAVPLTIAFTTRYTPYQ